jgi:hypothetical protein
VDTSLANRLYLDRAQLLVLFGKIFCPAGLTILYPTNVATSWSFAFWRRWACMILAGCAWHHRKAKPVLLVGWLWFLIALAPVIRGIRFDELSAFSDRYTYLPGLESAGFWLGRRGELTEKAAAQRPVAGVRLGLVGHAWFGRMNNSRGGGFRW